MARFSVASRRNAVEAGGIWASVLALARGRTSRRAGILTLGQYLTVVSGLITVTIATRLLGAAGYGAATLVMAYPSFLRSILDFKSISVVTRYISNFIGAGRTEQIGGIVKTGYLLDFAVATLTVLLVAFTGPSMAARVFNVEGLGWLAVAYAAFFPLASLKKTSQSVMNSYHEFGWVAAFNVAAELLSLVLIVGALLLGYGVAGYVLATALVLSLTGIGMTVIAARILSRHVSGWWRAPIGALKPIAREVAAFFGWNNLMATLAAVANQAPVLVLGHVVGKEAAGFFNLAKTIMTVGSYPEDSLRQVTFPMLAKRWGAGERRGLVALARRWTLTGGAAIAAIPLVGALVAPYIVPRLFGTGFAGAVLGIQLLLLGSMAGAAFFYLKSLYFAAGEIARWTLSYVPFALLALGLGWVAASRAGFAGMAAVNAAVDAVFVLTMTAWIVWRLRR